MVPVIAGAAVPRLHVHRGGPVVRPRVGIVLDDHYWDDTRRGRRVQAHRPRDRRRALRLSRQRRHELSLERHGSARLPVGGGPRARHPGDPRRGSPIPGHPVRCGHGPRPQAHPAAVVAAAGRPGDGIPSRAEHAISQEEFDRRMPNEFWREVVDRVAAEVPDTLLLAEAFWMLEGYFVRTLGMHRVYNSAFMHMLRDENGAGYRKLIHETLEFDPEILKRYVNFMSNPDEETALEQFGTGDKYFGVATVMATLPGLPMLGHGQVEGYAEKYGMEFRRARLDEKPDLSLVERHQREIFPLLHRRAWFAEAHDFLLYDLVTDGGGVDESVLAYSNGSGPTRSLVVYHTRFGSIAGTIRESAAYRAQVRERGEAPGPPIAGRGPRSHERSLDVRDVPRREDRAAVHPLIPRTVGARSVAVARRVPGPRVLGVRRGPRRDRRPVAAPRRAAGRRRRSVARRRAGRAAAGAGPRAAPGPVRGRPRGGDHRWVRRRRRPRRAGGAGCGAPGGDGRVDRRRR